MSLFSAHSKRIMIFQWELDTNLNGGLFVVIVTIRIHSLSTIHCPPNCGSLMRNKLKQNCPRIMKGKHRSLLQEVMTTQFSKEHHKKPAPQDVNHYPPIMIIIVSKRFRLHFRRNFRPIMTELAWPSNSVDSRDWVISSAPREWFFSCVQRQLSFLLWAAEIPFISTHCTLSVRRKHNLLSPSLHGEKCIPIFVILDHSHEIFNHAIVI